MPRAGSSRCLAILTVLAALVAAAACTNALSADQAVVPAPVGAWWCDDAGDGRCYHTEAQCADADTGRAACARRERAICFTYLIKESGVNAWKWACWGDAGRCRRERDGRAGDPAVRKTAACEPVAARAEPSR